MDDFDFNKKIEVDNILTEPSNMEQKFILIGKDENMQGIIVAIDFSSFH